MRSISCELADALRAGGFRVRFLGSAHPLEDCVSVQVGCATVGFELVYALEPRRGDELVEFGIATVVAIARRIRRFAETQQVVSVLQFACEDRLLALSIVLLPGNHVSVETLRPAELPHREDQATSRVDTFPERGKELLTLLEPRNVVE